jgi:DNA polymerase-3 subunit gamma/tau
VPTTTQTNAEPAPHRALYRRWRAQTFSEMVGQQATVTTLRNAVRLGRLGHGFLFVGPRGTGKTSMARILAKAINCTDLQDGEPCDRCPSCVAIREGRALDVIELDAASNNRVDDMRELLPRVYTAASDLRRKVFIIDEVQRIKEGWDVLLKTLEEPPEGVVFVFCTTDSSQIRPAVVSRLQRFTFRPLPAGEIEGKLRRILDAEDRRVDPDALELIARLAAGGMRDAESILDQVLGTADDPISASVVRDLLGLATEQSVERFVDALVDSDALAGIAVLDQLEQDGRDVVGFSEQVVARLRERLVAAMESRQGHAAVPRLGRAARRLVGIDASRSGLGGYRWQLELALLDTSGQSTMGRAPAWDEDAEPAASTPTARPELGAPSASTPVASSDPPGPANEAPALAGAAAPGAANEAVAPAPVAPSVPPGTASSPADDLFERLRQGWPEVIAQVSRNPANRPLVNACRPVEVRDGVVVLGFPEDQAFLRDIAERKRSALEEGIASVLGRTIGVRCVVANVELGAPALDGGHDLVAQARRIFEGDLADVGEVS